MVGDTSAALRYVDMVLLARLQNDAADDRIISRPANCHRFALGLTEISSIERDRHFDPCRSHVSRLGWVPKLLGKEPRQHTCARYFIHHVPTDKAGTPATRVSQQKVPMIGGAARESDFLGTAGYGPRLRAHRCARRK